MRHCQGKQKGEEGRKRVREGRREGKGDGEEREKRRIEEESEGRGKGRDGGGVGKEEIIGI